MAKNEPNSSPIEGSEEAISADLEQYLRSVQLEVMREQRDVVLSGVFEQAKTHEPTAELLRGLSSMREKLLQMLPDVSNEAVAATLIASSLLLSHADRQLVAPQLSCESILLTLSKLIDET